MLTEEIATVQDLIEHLERNFRPDDMLCFFFEGGAWCELEHVSTSKIGEPGWMFNRVEDNMRHELENLGCRKEDADEMKAAVVDGYRMVKGDNVVIY